MAEETEARLQSKLQFHYIKGAEYRETPCHGVVGSVIPNQRSIFVALFSERGPIPRMVEYDIQGGIGETIKFDEGAAKPSLVDTRKGIVRQIQFGTYLDLEIAKRVRDWLSKQIEQIESAQKGKK